MSTELRAGMQVWFVPSTSGGANEAKQVTVEKVGRKWATLSNGRRIDVVTWIADEKDWPGGQAWRTKFDWNVHVLACEEFRKLVRNIGHSPNAGVTHQDIEQVAVLLRITLK